MLTTRMRGRMNFVFIVIFCQKRLFRTEMVFFHWNTKQILVQFVCLSVCSQHNTLRFNSQTQAKQKATNTNAWFLATSGFEVAIRSDNQTERLTLIVAQHLWWNLSSSLKQLRDYGQAWASIGLELAIRSDNYSKFSIDHKHISTKGDNYSS